MSRFLVDTSVLAAYLNERPGALTDLRPMIIADEAVTSIVVYAELWEYLLGFGDRARRAQQLHALMRVVPPLALTRTAAERYAEIRRALRPPCGPGVIGDADTLIAATALVSGLTVVTTDSDFERVPGLSTHRLDRAMLRGP